MIAIGCASTDERAFRAAAARTIQHLDEGSSLLLRHHRRESFDAPCNEMLDVAARRDDLEAFLLVHEDATVTVGAPTVEPIRELLADPAVAIVAAHGNAAPRPEGALGAPLLALSPWAVRNLRFDGALGASADACAYDVVLQARAEGRRVLESPLGIGRAWNAPAPAARRRELSAMVELQRKWDPRTR